MNSHKPGLLLLHGALGSKNQFGPLVKLLKTDFETYAINFSGHGNHPHIPDRFTLSLFTQDILDFLDQGAHKAIHIFGYSMGGYVALNLAKGHGGRIGKVMTLATKFDWDPESAAREQKMLDADKIEEKVPAFAQILKDRHTSMGWKPVLEKTAGMMQGLGNGHALDAGDLNSIHTPVMVLLGTKDRMVTKDESIRAAGALAQGQFKPLADAEHPLEKINPSELSALMIDYFKN